MRRGPGVSHGVGIAVGIATVLSVAVAQPEQSSAPQDRAKGEAGEPPEGTIEAEEAADLTPEEQLKRAKKIRSQAAQLSKRIQSMLEQARRQGDIILVTCLNDKLSQVNANRRTLGKRVENLEKAIDAGDADQRDHEYTVITVLDQKFDTLEQEANQCLGEDVFETGATKVVTSIDPATPDDDPTQIPEPPGVDVPFIPPPASPTT